MLNKTKIVKYFHEGNLETVAHDLRMYGTIIGDSRWEETEKDGSMAGSHRVLKINHHGKHWELYIYNGEIKELGYNVY